MISSAKNPKVAQAVRLKKHAFREEDGRFLAEGPQAVREALASDGLLEVLFAVDEVDPPGGSGRAHRVPRSTS